MLVVGGERLRRSDASVETVDDLPVGHLVNGATARATRGGQPLRAVRAGEVGRLPSPPRGLNADVLTTRDIVMIR